MSKYGQFIQLFNLEMLLYFLQLLHNSHLKLGLWFLQWISGSFWHIKSSRASQWWLIQWISIHLHQYPRILRFWCRSAKRLGANKRMIEIVIYCFVSVTDTPGHCAERNCPRLGSNPGRAHSWCPTAMDTLGGRITERSNITIYAGICWSLSLRGTAAACNGGGCGCTYDAFSSWQKLLWDNDLECKPIHNFKYR